jgi:hypothetical protein
MTYSRFRPKYHFAPRRSRWYIAPTAPSTMTLREAIFGNTRDEGVWRVLTAVYGSDTTHNLRHVRRLELVPR